MSTTAVGAQPVRVAEAGTPGTLYNRDTVNGIFWGTTAASANRADASILDAQAGVPLDGSSDIYAVIITPGAAVLVDFMPTATGRTPGTLNANITNGSLNVNASVTGVADVNITSQTASLDVSAAAVNVIGEGGFILPGQLNLLDGTSAFSAGAGLTSTQGPYTVTNYSSIQMLILNSTTTSTAVNAAVCAIFRFDWFDAAGNQIGSDMVSTLIGIRFCILVPVKGSKVKVNLLNVGGGGTIAVASASYFLWGDYRTPNDIEILEYISFSPVAITGWTEITPNNPVTNVAKWISAFNSTNAGATAPSTQYLLILPLWNGNVQGWYHQVTNALAKDATIVDLTYAVQSAVISGTAYNFGILQDIPSAIAANPTDFSYNSPPTQLALLFQTAATVGQTFVMLTGD